MSFFISDAWAEAAPASAAPSIMEFVPLLLIFVVFYFLLIRPQMKRAKEHKKMTEALAKNDEVVTTGGLLGKIARIDESFVTLEIADGVEIKVQRSAITALMPKGTYKS
ncbi:MAG: preprotein translocase subunit YajC [Gammaproteobacteria bacterium]